MIELPTKAHGLLDNFISEKPLEHSLSFYLLISSFSPCRPLSSCLFPKRPTTFKSSNTRFRPIPMAGNAMEVVKGVDLERYMGRWYEIASFPSRFQPKNGANTRATYALNPDGTVKVLNETWTDGGKRGFIEGTAYKADPGSDEAKLKVRFYVPPFLPIIPVTGDYWVLALDGDYQFALIGEPSRRYLWVMSCFSFKCFYFYFAN